MGYAFFLEMGLICIRNSDTKKIMNYGEADKRLFLGHCTFTIKLY